MLDFEPTRIMKNRTHTNDQGGLTRQFLGLVTLTGGGLATASLREFMSVKVHRPIVTAGAVIVVLLFQGCAQDTPPESGPIIDGHSNVTFSGYTRAGVIFSGR
jgi:hypothetical protein